MNALNMTDTVLRIELDVPIECAFRKADAFNALHTYPIPPITTLRGLIYAAMGRPSLLNQDSKPYTPSKDTIDQEREFREMFRQTTDVSIQPTELGTRKTDLRRRMKVARSDDNKQYMTYVAQEETIISPRYRAYVCCTDEELREDIKKSLDDPERLLYLGRSDDLLTIDNVSEHTFKETVLPEDETILAPAGHGENPFLIPVSQDFKDTYTTKPAKSQLVSKVTGEYECKEVIVDGEKEYFEFFT